MSRLGTWLSGVRAGLSPKVRARDAYTRRREDLIRESSMRALEGGDWLAAGGPRYGAGLDERVVEYPWTYARLGRGERLLDVGSTLNAPFHIGLVRGRFGEVVFLNPFRDDGHRSLEGGVSYVASDVRSHYLRPGSFDRITCLSTLEHVACDNTRYGEPSAGAATREEARAERARAMHSMRELLRADGALLLTVPFGMYEDHGWFVQLDATELDHAVEAFGAARSERRYFRLGDGWRPAQASECAQLRYGSACAGASAVACVELQP